MDVLTDVLNSLQLRSSLYCRSELATPWGLHFVHHECAVFHVVERRPCWLQLVDETNPRLLHPGDLVVLPHGTAHIIADQPTSPTYPPVQMDYDAYRACQLWQTGAPADTTLLLCGTFDFAYADHHPLFSLLPKVIHLTGGSDTATAGLATTLHFMATEAGSHRPGAETLLRRLTDVLFIQVIRYWVEQHSDGAQGWLGALRHPQIGKALGLLHQQPAQNWTVETLARAVAMSRSAFAAGFRELVGEPPLQYLARWRMRTATRLLQQERLGMSDIALRVGYQSEVAFSKAFKREMGIAPGAYRRQGRVPA